MVTAVFVFVLGSTNALRGVAGVSGIVYAWDADRMEEKHHMGGEARGRTLTRSHDDIVLILLVASTDGLVSSR